MTKKVTDMLEFLSENGVHVNADKLFMNKTETQQLNLLFKIFKEMVA